MNQPYTHEKSDNSLSRISYLMIVVFLISGALLFRMFQKTVIEHGQYVAMAKNQYYISEENPSKRGVIYAEDITSEDKVSPIATNIERFSIGAVPKNIKDKKEVAKELADILGMDKQEIFDKINNDKPYIPPIKKGVEKDISDKVINLKLAGIYIQSESDRYYPDDNLASQVLGFVDAQGKGEYGIESYYNDQLRGRGGMMVGEKDTLGRVISVTEQEEVKNGTNLVLTIERNVQYTAQQILKSAIDKYQADDGSITIIEPSTGKIIAMAGYPDFNPNKYNEVPTDQQSLFLNPVISDVYEPGSIFKPIVMSAAVNEGKIEPDTTGDFSNMTVVQGYEIHTAQDKAFGHETMTQVMENSDNVAMVWVADQLGNETMFKYLDQFGFGHKTGIDLSGETTGSMLQLKNWRDINRATISFGQGISVTPLQVLLAISTIANNGVMMKPYVVDKLARPEGDVETKPQEIARIISEDSAHKTTGMMISVVINGHGKKAAVSGYSVAGKTGTAQVPRPASEGGGYYDDKHVGSFAGFFPADNPRFAMLVRLSNPKNTDWAEASAAPTFGEMAKWMLDYYQIPPNQ